MEEKGGEEMITEFEIHRTKSEENELMKQSVLRFSDMELAAHSILGLEHNPVLFHKLYAIEAIEHHASEIGFLKKLAIIAMRPVEMRELMWKVSGVQQAQPIDGFWKLSGIKRDQNSNGVHECYDPTGFDSVESRKIELERLRTHVQRENADINARLRIIELEEEIKREKSTDEQMEQLARRHYDEIWALGIKFPESVALPLKLMECHWEMTKNKAASASVARRICNWFPQDPSVWANCLSFVQYNDSLYKDYLFKEFILKCLNHAHDLLAGFDVWDTIDNLPAFRCHYLNSFIRYLRWLLAVGHTPIVLASIQATMEFNFAFAGTIDVKERYEQLKHFWSKKLPRIGDKKGSGGPKMLQMDWTIGKEAELEIEEYKDLVRKMNVGIEDVLSGDDLRLNWVRFERFMAGIDGRVKRTPFKESSPYKEDVKMKSFNFYDEIDFNSREYTRKKQLVVFYPSVGNDVFEFLQPILEFLGIRFSNSTGLYSSTEQVISEWISYGSLTEIGTNFDEIPTYTESTCREVGQRILTYLMASLHEKCKENPQELDKQLMKYVLARTETVLCSEEKQLKSYTFDYETIEKAMKQILTPREDGDEGFEEIVNAYPIMKKVIGLIGTAKMITWEECALEELLEFERLNSLKKRTSHENQTWQSLLNVKANERSLNDVKKELFGMLDSIDKTLTSVENSKLSLKDPALPYVDLQLRLYSTILKSRLFMIPGCQVRAQRDLTIAVLGEPNNPMDRMDNVGISGFDLREEMEQLARTVRMRDQDERKCGVPELPSAGALVTSLRNAIYILFAKRDSLDQKTIDQITTEAIDQCREYEANKAISEQAVAQKDIDRIDIQFVIDTLFKFFSYREQRFYYRENYQKLVLAASQAFSCHSKYMKMLAELFLNSQHQLIQLRTILNERNEGIREKMKTQADASFERSLLQNSLAIMYATKKYWNKRDADSKLILYTTYLAEAKQIHDPAIWRMVLKQAAAVSMSKLKEEAYVSAVSQCNYARNIHIDFAEYVECQDYRSVCEVVQRTALNIMEVATEEQLSLFVDEFEVLEKFQKWNRLRIRNQMQQN